MNHSLYTEYTLFTDIKCLFTKVLAICNEKWMNHRLTQIGTRASAPLMSATPRANAIYRRGNLHVGDSRTRAGSPVTLTRASMMSRVTNDYFTTMMANALLQLHSGHCIIISSHT